MFAHLLVPLDGSATAESVLPAASLLARRMDARLTLVHVLEPAPPARIHGERHLGRKDEAEAYLREVAAWLEAHGASAQTRVERGGGDVALQIFRGARAVGADLVALCTHGGRGVRGFLFGRVAQQVLSHGDIPVLLVPPRGAGREDPFDVRRILLPLDGSPTAETAIPAATSLARQLDAALLLDWIVPTVGTLMGERGVASRLMPTAAAKLLEDEARQAAAYLQRTAARLREGGVEVGGVVERGDVGRVLGDAASRHRTDMTVMATHGRSGVSAVWAGSVASRVLERSSRPVLLVRIAPVPAGAPR